MLDSTVHLSISGLGMQNSMFGSKNDSSLLSCYRKA